MKELESTRSIVNLSLEKRGPVTACSIHDGLVTTTDLEHGKDNPGPPIVDIEIWSEKDKK
jgi:hypothetical protein